jgi:hypothetical protein
VKTSALKKFCPECQKEGQRSKVYIGATSVTLMAVHRYYDEDGDLHVDDPNKMTTTYSCSNGHQWREVS